MEENRADRTLARVETRAATGDWEQDALAHGYRVVAGHKSGEESVREVEGRRAFGWRLARLGGVRRKQFYGAVARPGIRILKAESGISAIFAKRTRSDESF